MNPACEPQRRWFRLTPDRFVIGLLAVECLLWLLDSLDLFGKGWPLLIAIACVGVVFIAMILWLATSLIFRWRFQFSIRSVFVLMLAIAIPSGCLAVNNDRARRQSETVERTRKLGGWVEYDWLYEANGKILSTAHSPGAAFLLNVLGEDFFSQIILVDLGGTQVNDVGLEYIKSFTELHGLILSRTQVTDAGLEHLKRLTRLQVLALNGTRVTNAGLERLNGLSRLQRLGLDGTKVTEEGVKMLQQALPNCKVYWDPPKTKERK